MASLGHVAVAATGTRCYPGWIFLHSFHVIAPGLSSICLENKMRPTNPNAHTHLNGTDVETHGYAVKQNTFLQ
jgi:hypothetical protein